MCNHRLDVNLVMNLSKKGCLRLILTLSQCTPIKNYALHQCSSYISWDSLNFSSNDTKTPVRIIVTMALNQLKHSEAVNG